LPSQHTGQTPHDRLMLAQAIFMLIGHMLVPLAPSRCPRR
jgi:hypothetical protein